MQQLNQATRSRLLMDGLRQFRYQAERSGRGDQVHQLRNTVATVQGALGLVEQRLTRGDEPELELLLDLAETRLREGRALLARHATYGRSPTRRAA
jgi:hypothetical protein